MSWDLPANSNSSADQTMAPSQGTVIIRQFLQHYIGLKIQTWCSDCPRWWYWAVRTVYWLRYICMISDAGVGSMLVESVGGCGWVTWLCGCVGPIRTRQSQWGLGCWGVQSEPSEPSLTSPPPPCLPQQRDRKSSSNKINVSWGLTKCESVTVCLSVMV